MYSDAFDHHPDHRPAIGEAMPSTWRRRALGLGLLALLVLMHSCS